MLLVNQWKEKYAYAFNYIFSHTPYYNGQFDISRIAIRRVPFTVNYFKGLE